MSELLKYSLPILGVIIGASIQFLFSNKNENKKQQRLLKTTAYTDFLKAVAGLAITQKYGDKEKEMEYLILLSDAKARVSVYGNDEVVKGIADFWRIGPKLNNPKSNKAYSILVLEMRKDNLKSVKTELKDISQLLLSEDIQ